MMNFIRSFFGTCCGTEVFGVLRNHSVGRVLRHLLLMTVLCAVCIGVGSYYSLKYRWREAEAAFNAGFGTQLHFDKKGVHPDIDPQLSRRQEFPYNGLLIYVSPEGREKDYPDITLFDRNFILLWHPACLAFTVREGNSWIFGTYNADGKMELVVTPLLFADMKKQLFAAAEMPPSDKWHWNNAVLSSRQLFKDFRLAYSNVKAIEYFLREIIMVLLGTLFFASFFRLFSRRKFPQLTFAAVWKVAVYAAFPVLLVVSMFPALLLPGMGYFNELFVLGWVIYLFFVLRSLILYPEEPEEKKGENDYERQ